MATRRPKVPKANLTGSSATGANPAGNAAWPAGGSDDGEVISADFGANAGSANQDRSSSQDRTSSNGRTRDRTATSGAERAASGRAASGRAASGRAASGRAASGRDRDSSTPVPARAFSGRLLALGVVMVAITVMLAPTVKIFFEKRAEIAALQDEIAARKAEQEGLRKQVSRWQDPSYVKQQARDRINMVMPGETGYWVFGGGIPSNSQESSTGTGASGSPANLPWVDALWESIRRSATD